LNSRARASQEIFNRRTSKKEKNPGEEQGVLEEEYIFEIQAYGIRNTVYQ
jgi:hypothetical protein